MVDYDPTTLRWSKKPTPMDVLGFEEHVSNIDGLHFVVKVYAISQTFWRVEYKGKTLFTSRNMRSVREAQLNANSWYRQKFT